VREAKGALVEIKGVAQGACGALICGDDSPSARQRFCDLLGQRVRMIHTPFIRLPGAEKQRVGESAVWPRIVLGWAVATAGLFDWHRGTPWVYAAFH
jgi:hypothetical protein